MPTMRAAVIRAAGGPEALVVEERPVPVPRAGEVLIRVRAFGLNRSELFTRRGLSPDVRFPRVPGIEAVGTVEAAPGGEVAPGAAVATVMGGMGRDFDGSYAEFTCVPAGQVQVVAEGGAPPGGLSWETLGAIPEMLQTAWGSLFTALRLEGGERLLVRGGTTSVGLAAATLARAHGAVVGATTRSAARAPLLRGAGAAEVFVDDGAIAGAVCARWPGGADKVLELVGTATLEDSLRCVRPGGIACMTGMVGDRWTLPDFSPMTSIPTAVCLTTYSGGVRDFMAMPFAALVGQVAAGTLRVHVGQVFRLEQIAEAHRCMEENGAGGKIVVLP